MQNSLISILVIFLCCGAAVSSVTAAGATCSVLDFGAVGDGITDNTKAIQQAIDDCEEVVIPEGDVFVSGSLFLKSNLVLRIDGEMLGSSDKELDTYPMIYTRRGGTMTMSRASLINGGRCLDIDYNPIAVGDQCKEWGKISNVTITGKGTINGNGDSGWTDERYNAHRPTLLGLGWISGLTITDVFLTNPPFWTTHVLFCNDVHIARVRIESLSTPNGDGIDPDSSSNILIEDCSITSTDDVIAIKSGKDIDGRTVGIATENVTIRNMYFEQGHGVAIGSEMSGDIRNIVISNLTLNGTGRGVRIKSEKGRGGTVENIQYENLVMTDVKTPISITMFYEDGTHGYAPEYRNITVRNVTGLVSEDAYRVQSAGEILCLPLSPCTGMKFIDIDLSDALEQNEEEEEEEFGYDCQYMIGVQANVNPPIECLRI